MLKRKRTWILFTLLLTLGAGVYFEPSYCVRGWLFREAFFEGRPTSYWRTVVVRDLNVDAHLFFVSRKLPRNWWQRCQDWIGYEPRVDSSVQLLDEAALPILHELTEDATPQVAAFARDVIDTDVPDNPNVPPGVMVSREHWVHIRWMELIARHSLRPRPGP